MNATATPPLLHHPLLTNFAPLLVYASAMAIMFRFQEPLLLLYTVFFIFYPP